MNAITRFLSSKKISSNSQHTGLFIGNPWYQKIKVLLSDFFEDNRDAPKLTQKNMQFLEGSFIIVLMLS